MDTVYQTGFPPEEGWYDCLLDGDPVMMKYYICKWDGDRKWLDPADGANFAYASGCNHDIRWKPPLIARTIHMPNGRDL